MVERTKFSRKGKICIGKWVDLLPHIEKTNLCKLARSLDITYSYANAIVREFQEKGWIIKEKKKGRSRVTELTPLGKEVVGCCYHLGGLINDKKNR